MEQDNIIKLSVIVPCYNEATGIPALCERTAKICRDTIGNSFELVLINDGSTDTTWQTMCVQSQNIPQIKAVNLARNFGHQVALTAGLSVCTGEHIFIIDADLQDPPELLPDMIKTMKDHDADIVYGQRLSRKGESWFKRLSAALFYRMLGKMTKNPIPHDAGDFRLVTRRVVDILNDMPERSRFLRGMAGWIGLKQVPYAYERQSRHSGTTKYPLRKMIHFALDAITGFSVLPLRLAAYFGAAFGVASLGMLAYVFSAWLNGETVQGWTSLMVVVLLIGSVQLICIGVFGEYLGRLYMETKQRPLFIIDKIVQKDSKA